MAVSIIKNQYKRLDVFRCRVESHKGFGNIVSVYHVLKENVCYPKGCVYFKWKCSKLEHKLPCPKSYNHIGRKCTACPEYYDEKLIKRPKLLLSEAEYTHFLKELRSFELWLNSMRGRVVNCAGTIRYVKPRFVVFRKNDKNSLAFKGFLLSFEEGFIDLAAFNDTFYACLSPSQQSRIRLADGDRLEFKATLHLDRGRILLKRLYAIEIEEKSKDRACTITDARRALTLGRLLDQQYDKCLQCPDSILVDIMGPHVSKEGLKKRRILCLKGIAKPEYCIVQASKMLCPVNDCRDDTVMTHLL